jgi:hypothetical protein
VNVGELRNALSGLPDTMDVVVRATADDGTTVCNTPWQAGTDRGCAGHGLPYRPFVQHGEEFFAIEVSEVDDG